MSLREALEKLATDLDDRAKRASEAYDLNGVGGALRGVAASVRELLAAHPEPATGVTEQAVKVGLHVVRTTEKDGRAAVREMLEACSPYMGVRPVVDREAVWRGIYSAVIQQLNPSEITDIATDAVMKQIHAKPTRKQVDELLQEWRVGPAHRPFAPDFPNELPNYRRKLRNAVMDLLAGGGSEASA